MRVTCEQRGAAESRRSGKHRGASKGAGGSGHQGDLGWNSRHRVSNPDEELVPLRSLAGIHKQDPTFSRLWPEIVTNLPLLMSFSS